MRCFSLDIDTGMGCNLRCPACARGNTRDCLPPQGALDPELLRKILDEATGRFRIPHVNLFIWSEPLLHQRVHELVAIVRERGIRCNLSSNLNYLPDVERLLAADPSSIKVSVSGFTQEVYGRTHRGGDVERVKRNLAELAAAVRARGGKTRLYVEYHRYRDNLAEEPLFRSFAAGIGAGFEAAWAQFLPLEKILRHGGEKHGSLALTDGDRETIASLLLPLPEALSLSRRLRKRLCPLRERQISLDFRGNVLLCCGAYDSDSITIGPFLDLSLDEIQRRRHEHPLCNACIRQGGHVYLTQGSADFDRLALAHAAPEEATLSGLRREVRLNRIRRSLELAYGYVPFRLSPRGEALLGAMLRRARRFLPR